MKIKVLAAVVLMALLALYGWKVYLDNRGFTPWLTVPELKEHIQPLEDQGADGKSGWHGRWITDIQSRWEDGRAQYRIRIADAPNVDPNMWNWLIEQDERGFKTHFEEMKKQNFFLVSYAVYDMPKGERGFAGVWHRKGD